MHCGVLSAGARVHRRVTVVSTIWKLLEKIVDRSIDCTMPFWIWTLLYRTIIQIQILTAKIIITEIWVDHWTK